ncbi:MAG: hypothetical protein M3460_15675 [Actinomycetota bacterium]|nr:hypothetical protein [Actinomycetota bacterium]
MGAPDTSGIDLDNVRCWTELVSCLRQLRVEAGRPSYSKLDKFAGGKLRPSTLSDLIGEKALARSSYSEWDTVRLFVLACNVPEAELDSWWKAWKIAVAPDRPTCQEERQHLLATIDQLTANLTAAQAQIDQDTTALAASKDQVDQLTTNLAAAEARIDQLTAAVKEAEARALAAEAMLAGILRNHLRLSYRSLVFLCLTYL